ncbi:MAG: methionine biosynthesis protein MetW [Desulfocapsa sp.]|nr:methionine biosynthesis protein MetW [Desulfocapsa sp.]
MASQVADQLRFDLAVIASWIEPGARVLDLGCGHGDLLAWLKTHKQIVGTGVEQDKEKAAACISRGLTVLQGDLKDEVSDYLDASFDVVILSQTLQQVYQPDVLLRSLSRIGRQVIVSFPNFSHYSIRLQLLFKGQAPKSPQLPFSWYDTPNIRVITLADFRKFSKEVGYTIVKECAINTHDQDRKGKIVTRFSNLLATYGIFLIENREVL